MSKNSIGYNRRIYNTPGELISAAIDILRSSADFKSVARSDKIDRAFAEKIMLAVTQVNECRYCRYGHTKAALAAGVSEEEIAVILRGDFEKFPREQGTALLFAQHFAETGGAPDPAVLDRLTAYYGEQTAAEIIFHIRMIMVGNLLGNTFDAFLSRFVGHPAPDSSLVSELSTLLLAALGVIPFGIIFALRML
jgi:AhpD family alkylhydroperoxidase